MRIKFVLYNNITLCLQLIYCKYQASTQYFFVPVGTKYVVLVRVVLLVLIVDII